MLKENQLEQVLTMLSWELQELRSKELIKACKEHVREETYACSIKTNDDDVNWK